MSKTSLFSEDSSLSFSIIFLKLLVNSKRKSGLEISGLGSSENSAI